MNTFTKIGFNFSYWSSWMKFIAAFQRHYHHFYFTNTISNSNIFCKLLLSLILFSFTLSLYCICNYATTEWICIWFINWIWFNLIFQLVLFCEFFSRKIVMPDWKISWRLCGLFFFKFQHRPHRWKICRKVVPADFSNHWIFNHGKMRGN